MNKTEWNNRMQDKQKLEQDKKNLDLATIDKIMVGDEENEEKHQLSGKSYMAKGNKGIDNKRYWRVASDTTGFGYKLKINTGKTTKIQMRFLGPAHYEVWDCLIKVNNIVLDTLIREKEVSSPSHLVLTHSLAGDWTNIKDSINVWFVVKEGWKMPKLIEIRTIKE